jgi:hypothetical protein
VAQFVLTPTTIETWSVMVGVASVSEVTVDEEPWLRFTTGVGDYTSTVVVTSAIPAATALDAIYEMRIGQRSASSTFGLSVGVKDRPSSATEYDALSWGFWDRLSFQWWISRFGLLANGSHQDGLSDDPTLNIGWDAGTRRWFRSQWISEELAGVGLAELRFKVWSGAMEDEPAEWDYELPIGHISIPIDAGQLGIYLRSSVATQYIEVGPIYVGTEGDAPPVPLSYELPTTRYAGAFLIELDPLIDWTGVAGVIEGSDGSAWLDYTKLPVSGGTENRVISREISDSADAPVRTLRAVLHMNTANGSLSSGAVDSPFNLLSGAFSPAIFGGRRIIVQEPLASPTSTDPEDWRPRFWGHIDDHPANSAGDIQIFARDAAARLMVPYTGDPVWIGTEGELIPLNEAIQAILDATTSPAEWILKTVGGDLEWAIPAFQLGNVNDVLQTIRDAAQQRGAVFRWWMDETTGRFQATLFVLQEEKLSPDFTYSASQTVDIPAHGSDIASYRNDFTLRYPDSTSGEIETITRPATESEIASFGKRPLVISEASTSQITTEAEANVMLDSVEAALRVPATVGSRMIPRNELVEVNTLLRFLADARVSQETVDLYVVGWSERIAMSGGKMESSTRVDLRGAPVGQIGAWLRSIRAAAVAQQVADLVVIGQSLGGVSAIIVADGPPTTRTTGDALVQGDQWIDEDDGNKPYIWSGSAWVEAYTTIDGGSIKTGAITSIIYTPGVAGWIIDTDGSAEFNDVVIRGELDGATGTFTGVLKIIEGDSNSGIDMYDEDGVTPLGYLRPGGGRVELQAENDFRIYLEENPRLQVVEPFIISTPHDASLVLYTNIAGTIVPRNVLVDVANSGGAGFRRLVVDN